MARPGLDDDPRVAALIELWVAAQRSLEARQLAILAVLERLDSDGDSAARVGERLRLQLRRLEALESEAVAVMASIRSGTSGWVTSGGISDIYVAGATTAGVGGFSFVQAHQSAVAALSQDLFTDVLALTRHVERDTRLWVRRLSRELTANSLTTGRPTVEAIRELKRLLRGSSRLRRVGGITYANGAVHGFGEYAAMLLATKTGVVYNMGTLNNGKLAGIEFYELFDGANCQLYSHNQGPMASGLIVDYETAINYPLAHPGCVRSYSARPDVTRANLSEAESLVSAESRADQVAFDASLGRV